MYKRSHSAPQPDHALCRARIRYSQNRSQAIAAKTLLRYNSPIRTFPSHDDEIVSWRRTAALQPVRLTPALRLHRLWLLNVAPKSGSFMLRTLGILTVVKILKIIVGPLDFGKKTKECFKKLGRYTGRACFPCWHENSICVGRASGTDSDFRPYLASRTTPLFFS